MLLTKWNSSVNEFYNILGEKHTKKKLLSNLIHDLLRTYNREQKHIAAHHFQMALPYYGVQLI